jgi:hypothetical protein
MARKKQGTLALEFANVVVSSFEMNAGSATLVVKLFQVTLLRRFSSSAYVCLCICVY